MGRKKLDIAYMNDDKRRIVTFNKRRAGILKKAHEISTLTGCGIILCITEEKNMIKAREYLQRYTCLTDALEALRTEGLPDHAPTRDDTQSCSFPHEEYMDALARQDGIRLMEIVSLMEKQAPLTRRSPSPIYSSLYADEMSQIKDLAASKEIGEISEDDIEEPADHIGTVEYFSHPYDLMCVAHALYPAQPPHIIYNTDTAVLPIQYSSTESATEVKCDETIVQTKKERTSSKRAYKDINDQGLSDTSTTKQIPSVKQEPRITIRDCESYTPDKRPLKKRRLSVSACKLQEQSC
jgi:hypothetical protein